VRSSAGVAAARPSTFDPLSLAGRVHRLLQMAAPLHVPPEIRAVAEHASEDEMAASEVALAEVLVVAVVAGIANGIPPCLTVG
jgi:hypothetical protein